MLRFLGFILTLLLIAAVLVFVVFPVGGFLLDRTGDAVEWVTSPLRDDDRDDEIATIVEVDTSELAAGLREFNERLDRIENALGDRPDNGQQTSPSSGTRGDSATSANFNPVLHHFNECVPEITSGCSFDPGVHEDQIGLAFGVDVSWSKGGMEGAPGRCDLVVLTPGWYENLLIVDGRFEIYNISDADRDGWIRVLAVQRAAEQATQYDCGPKDLEDVPVWTSDIDALKDGGVDSLTMGSSNSSTDARESSDSCRDSETLDGGCRQASVDNGGSVSFRQGDAVAGYEIVLSDGSRHRDCFFRNAPEDGTVTDGVVHPWEGEVERLKACG